MNFKISSQTSSHLSTSSKDLKSRKTSKKINLQDGALCLTVRDMGRQRMKK